MDNAPLSAADAITAFASESVSHALLRAFFRDDVHITMPLAFHAGFVIVMTGQFRSLFFPTLVQRSQTTLLSIHFAPSVSYSADFLCYLFHYRMTTRFHNCAWAESNPFMHTDARWSAATWPSHLLVLKAAVRWGRSFLMCFGAAEESDGRQGWAQLLSHQSCVDPAMTS